MTPRRAARLASPVMFLFALLSPTSAFAQRGQDAALVGVVRDASGGVLAGGRVTVSSPQLIGGSKTVIADEQGDYRFPFLPPGEYEVVVEQQGFKTTRRAGVTLVPGVTLIVDVKVDVAVLNETVVVEGLPSTIDVHTSAPPLLIDRALIDNLPLSRIVSEAANLAPGVARDIAFGGSQNANPLSLDGTSGNEPSWGTPTVRANVNWIDELQIVSIGADAQYGEFTGARENAITRSGSNRYSSLFDLWTIRPTWTANNRGSLSPQLQERFRPLEIVYRWQSDAQVGGPAIKDRLWFFSGSQLYREAYRPAGFIGVAKTPEETKVDSRQPQYITKWTGALRPAVRVEGFYEHEGESTTGANASPRTQPEAIGDAERSGSVWNARLQWTLSSRAFLELRHGGHDLDTFRGPPEERRLGPPAHYDQLTGITSVNAPSYSHVVSKPIGTSAHLTYFPNPASGRGHEIRGGYEIEHARLLQDEGYNGGRVFTDFDGRPDTVSIWAGSTYRPTFNRQTLYLQDGWNATDRVTLNLGVRGGFYNGAVPERGRVFESRSLSPRIGAAWDVGADHRTVVRAHYGRYHDAMATTFFDFLDPLSQNPVIVAQVMGPDQFEEVTRFGATLNASLDPDLKFSFADEYLAGIERQLRWGISLQAQVIRRDFKDSIGFIDTGSIWLPVQRTDPGPDGRAGTADDGGPITAFVNSNPLQSRLLQTNPAAAYRRYRGAQIVATRRFTRGFGFQGSYTWSRTIANFNNGFSSNAGSADMGTNGVFVNPNRAINFQGRTTHDYTHNLKGLWTLRLPAWGGVNVSGAYLYLSGRPWARSAALGAGIGTVFVEPRATRHMRAIDSIDLRVEKTFKPAAKAGTVGVFADVFNAWNQGVETTINNTSGPNLGVPGSWLEPRTLRAGVRMMF